MSVYKIVLRREPWRESGVWIVEAPDVQGCHTWGRTIEQARRHIREALSLCVDDAAEAVLDEQIKMPRAMRETVAAARTARTKAELEQTRARRAAEGAVVRLTRDYKLSLRDAGELIGLSRQRAHQLAAKGRPKKKA